MSTGNGKPPTPLSLTPPLPPPEDTPQAVKAYGRRLAMWGMLTVAGLVAPILSLWLAKAVGVNVVPQPAPAVMPANVENMEDQPEILYFCGRTENVRSANFQVAPWPESARKSLRWHIDPSQYVGTLNGQQIKDAFEVAWNAWAQSIQIEPAYVSDPDQAHVRSRFGEYDGSGKVLAWSELADGTSTKKQQQYDNGENWTISSNPSRATIDMVRVACHEIGHVLGLVHDDVGTGALMEPTYSLTIRFPTARDVSRLIDLGYKARPKTNGTPGGPTIKIEVSADTAALIDSLKKAGFKVEAVGKK